MPASFSCRELQILVGHGPLHDLFVRADPRRLRDKALTTASTAMTCLANSFLFFIAKLVAPQLRSLAQLISGQAHTRRTR
jgi:hypothetical protein